MDVDEVFLGPDHKCIKQYLMKFNDENSEKCVKCKVGEVNELLSLRKLVLQQPRYEKSIALSEAEWDSDLKLAKVTKVAKNLTKNFSHSRNKSIYLYPEECLCLMEMKCLVLTWKGRKLSIKNAFTLLLDFSSGCTFERFRTYGYLVKLGFRVFRHDKEIKNTNEMYSKDLTKRLAKTKKTNFTDNKQIKNVYDGKNKVAFPNTNYSIRVILPRPPSYLMPYNLLPKYDTYSFNLAIQSDGQTKITKVISHHESNNFKFPKLPIVYDSQSTGVYPVYEKNIPEVKPSVSYQNRDFNYVPPIKKSKLTKTEDICLPVKTSVTVSTSNDKSNLHNSSKMPKYTKELIDINNEKNMETEEVNLPSLCNVTIATLNDSSNALDNINETTNKLLLDERKQLNNEKIIDYSDQTLNLNSTEENYSNSELQKFTSSTSFEDNVFGNQLNIPSHIRKKLFAIKSKTVHNKSTDNRNNEQVHFDVYYPDNNIAKTTRPAPNFRVIVFENGDADTFPNIYKVNVSIPHDNVPMLWAIVNSSQVSFYNVNSIVLPKSSEWEIKSCKNDF